MSRLAIATDLLRDVGLDEAALLLEHFCRSTEGVALHCRWCLLTTPYHTTRCPIGQLTGVKPEHVHDYGKENTA